MEVWATVRIDHFQWPDLAAKDLRRVVEMVAVPRLFTSAGAAETDALRLSSLRSGDSGIEYFVLGPLVADDSIAQVDNPIAVIEVDRLGASEPLRREKIRFAELVASADEATAILDAHADDPALWGWCVTRWRRESA